MSDTPTIERETLWDTDAELIRRLGVPERQARQALRMMDRQPGYGFPKKDPIYVSRSACGKLHIAASQTVG
jgi:hypothetical protein